jgi:hypothetical protein
LNVLVRKSGEKLPADRGRGSPPVTPCGCGFGVATRSRGVRSETDTGVSGVCDINNDRSF